MLPCLLFDILSSPFFRTNHTQLCAETGEQVNHHKVYCGIVLLAQAECLCTIGSSKDAEPDPFERPLQKASKVVVVFDQQDGGRRLTAGREVKSLVR